MSIPGAQITRSTLKDQVLVVLRQRLVSGDLAPGGIYSAQAVAAELGVSGSPVREAMLILVNNGLMEPVRNRGFRVVALSAQDRRDIYEMRLWLEVPAMVKLAGDPRLIELAGQFQSIADGIVRAAREADLVEYLERDRDFHLGILAILENRRLLSSVEMLRDQTRLFGLQSMVESGRLVSSAEEHEHILAAMAGGNAEATRALMLTHLEHVQGDWA